MYENYTYDQVRELPDNQKITALTELKTIYPDNKDLAKHWDIAHIAVSNLISKYVEGKQIGRKKMTNEEKAQAKQQREAERKLQNQEQQTNNLENRRNEEDQKKEKEDIKSEYESINEINEKSQIKNNSFCIILEKNMIGEEAITRLSGIANLLLKENEYKVYLKIEEV